jgi:chromosome segregation ATPase
MEIEALETQLGERDAELLAAKSHFAESEAKFDNKVRELQCELAEKQLLNDSRATEIEDLNSQINRLLKESAQATVSLEQTDAALKNEIARLHQNHKAEISALRDELHRSQLEYEERTASFQTFDDEHRRELANLRAQLTEKQTLINGRDRDLEETRAKLAALNEELVVLQSSHRQEKEAFLSEANRTESALRAELTAKELSLEERDRTIKGLQDRVGAQTDGLQNELTELRQLVALRSTELQETKAAAEPLRRQVTDLEETVGASEQTRREAQAMVAALQAELTLSTKTLRDQEATAKHQEHLLQTEITALRTEAREKHDLLESRNEELVRVKAELDRVQERLNELESSAKREREAAATETETLRTEFQAQIAYLQAELSQKDWALAERQAARAVESAPQLQNKKSPRRRVVTLGSSEQSDEEFVLGEPRVAETQEERSKNLEALLETVKTEDTQRFAGVRQRRWHSGWRWKRRWKT